MGKGTIVLGDAPSAGVLTPSRTPSRFVSDLALWDFFAGGDAGSEEPVAPTPREKGDRRTDKRPSVLVVDDDPDVRTMLRTQLEIEGYPVIEAADGDQAWDALQRHHPAVVIADVSMPGRSGLELCRQARRAGFDSTGFIAYTAGMASTQETAGAGFDAHFLKTDPLPRLAQTVRRLASR